MLLGRVEHSAVKKTTLILHLHLISSFGHRTIAGNKHLILQTAGKHRDTRLLLFLGQIGIGSQEVLTSLLVGTIFLQKHIVFHNLHQTLGSLTGITDRHQPILTCGSADETSHEQFLGNAACAVIAKQFPVNAGHHLIGYLLANLDTCIVGYTLRVFISTGTFCQTLHEIIDIGQIDIQASCKKLFQTLSLCHTDGIAQRINTRHRLLCLYRIESSTRHKKGECYQDSFLHYFFPSTSSSSILKISIEKGLISAPC